jgi:hypothetical protein
VEKIAASARLRVMKYVVRFMAIGLN